MKFVKWDSRLAASIANQTKTRLDRSWIGLPGRLLDSRVYAALLRKDGYTMSEQTSRMVRGAGLEPARLVGTTF